MRILLVIVLFITLQACGFGNKESANQDKTSETTESANTETIKEVARDIWMNWQAPSSVGEFELDALVIDPYKNADLYSALAVYKKGETVFRVQIVAGSTEKGKSEIRDHFKIATQNINNESDYGYEKIMEHNGIKTKEEFLKVTGDYMVKFLYKEKYGVSIKSNAESIETVWNLVDQLQLEALN